MNVYKVMIALEDRRVCHGHTKGHSSGGEGYFSRKEVESISGAAPPKQVCPGRVATVSLSSLQAAVSTQQVVTRCSCLGWRNADAKFLSDFA
jgi:hypothetical protein